VSSDSNPVGERAHTTFDGDVHPRVCASVSTVVRTCRPARASREDAHPRCAALDTPGMGRHANYLNGMTSWRLAVTLALGRNTGPAISKDAGIQCSHGTPTTEAAPVDGASVGTNPELGVGISKLSAAKRCDDGTVTFQRPYPPREVRRLSPPRSGSSAACPPKSSPGPNGFHATFCRRSTERVWSLEMIAASCSRSEMSSLMQAR